MATATTTVYDADTFMNLVGDTITGVRVVNGDRLIFTTLGGKSIDAGSAAGFPVASPAASGVAVTPTNGVAATNAQAAIAELDGDFTALNTQKGDAADVKKILSGRLRHMSDYAADGSVVRTNVVYTNMFPNGYFLTPPQVMITPDVTNPGLVAQGWSTRSITTTGFTVNAWSQDVNASTNVAVQYNLQFHWVAVGN